jgi:hypothetical protein
MLVLGSFEGYLTMDARSVVCVLNADFVVISGGMV